MPELVTGAISKLEYSFLHFDEWTICVALELQNNGFLLKEIEQHAVLMHTVRLKLVLNFLCLVVDFLALWCYCVVLGVDLLLIGDLALADEADGNL